MSSVRAEAGSCSEDLRAHSDTSLKEYMLDVQINGLRIHARGAQTSDVVSNAINSRGHPVPVLDASLSVFIR